MKKLGAAVLVIAGLLVVGMVTALYLVATPEPSIRAPADIFDFASLRKAPADSEPPPSLRRYPARDGEQLAYRIYDSAADRILIFIHGSSYHGGGYHALASALSLANAAKVVLPNLRGHYMSGPHRGDVDYIGQFEDDLADLINFLRSEGHSGPITLSGHSSGGGLAIRFAGGPYASEISSYLLMAPIIPRSPAVRGGNAGGWSILHWKRIYGLTALNAIGIRGFNGLPIVQFNKPAKYWDGTETLSYSYRLNVSYHPRACPAHAGAGRWQRQCGGRRGVAEADGCGRAAGRDEDSPGDQPSRHLLRPGGARRGAGLDPRVAAMTHWG
jgi:non-heme chloroperoxidase